MATVMGTTNTESLDIQVYPRGAVGYHYTPEVDSDGILKWTNDGGLENPDDYRVKGDAATIKVGKSEISTDDTFEITNSGTMGDAVFDFKYPEPGTRVKLNGNSTQSRDISIYAPTTAGTNKYLLTSGGAGATPQWIEDKMLPYTILDISGDINDIITETGWYYIKDEKVITFDYYEYPGATETKKYTISAPCYLYVTVSNGNIQTLNSLTFTDCYFVIASAKVFCRYSYYQDLTPYQDADEVNTLIETKLTTDKYVKQTDYATASQAGVVKIKLVDDVLYISTDGSDL